MIKNKRL